MDHARPMAALLKINHWWILNRARSMAAKLTTLKFDVPKKKSICYQSNSFEA